MIKIMFYITVFICFSVIIFSCNAQSSNNNNKNKSIKNDNARDTVIKDIPLDKKGRPRSYYNNKKGVEDKLGLNTLESGFDSLQIRIWYGYAFNDTSQLIIFKNTDGRWSGEFHTLVYILSEKSDSIINISKLVDIREPKSGWEVFIKKIFSLNILSLPDYQSIPGYTQSTDGDAVIVETASKKKYRIYSYQEPNMHKDNYQQAEAMEQILELIEEEFGFMRLRTI